MLSTIILQLLLYIATFLFLLVAIAYLTLLERKIMAGIQRRRGPNVAGIFGLLQPFADGVKLLLKETIIPSTSNGLLFLCSPLFTFFCSIMLWMVVPFSEGMVYADLPYSLLYIFAISSLSVYGILFAGWSSNSKYAFLGGLRSAAQMISYEICIGFVLISVILMSSSFNLGDIILFQQYVWFIFPLLPLWVIFVICSLAETNRAPFDLPEAEAELVAGYNVEYSGITFALFFLGEYANILFMSMLSAIFFFGGWLAPCSCFSYIPGIIWFGLKFSLNVFIFVWVRASFPRFRYDQLMKLGWKVFLPFALAFVMLQSALIFILM